MTFVCGGCHQHTCEAPTPADVRESCLGWVRLVEANLGVGVPADFFFCSWACVARWAGERVMSEAATA